MYKIAIIDDDLNYINIIYEKMISLGYSPKSISTFTSVKDCEKCNTLFSLYILDVDMPEKSGFDFAENLSSYDTSIIFVSAYEKYIWDAFYKNVIGFISKKNLGDQLPNVLAKYNQSMKNDRLFIKNAKITCQILHKEIYYFESILGDIYIHQSNKDTIKVLNTSLHSLCADLPDCFKYISRNVIVNLNNVIAIKHNTLYLSDNTQLSISRRRVNEIHLTFAKLKMSGGIDKNV